MNLFEVLTRDKANETMAGRVYGVVTAVVVSIADPDELGRVKVAFPWLENNQESHWARVMSFMAGNDRGAVFRPEVDDEVLVVFEHGDMRYPYVIGALWNGKDKIPSDAGKNADNHVRCIKSRSGHKILFDDNSKEKKEKLEIKTNAGHTIVLDDASGKEKVGIQSKAGHKIVLDDASGGEKIEIADKTGSNKIVIDAVKKAIAVESGIEISIKSTKIAVEASGTLDLKTNGILTLKGSLVKIN